MFPNLFSPSPAVWAGLFGLMIALPVLIHLINLFRHRRVKWAAMDFLLQSYKRQRNWIRLKQLLLLLSRIAALVLALMMLGQVGCDNEQLSGVLGGRTVHHYVLVDDSFSMNADL
ncbi:MAG: BatA domain-containing protein, partial [Planctomycetales bacterium]|nr:BatA domain-containing protein [Planctomycetales bacterium]